MSHVTTHPMSTNAFRSHPRANAAQQNFPKTTGDKIQTPFMKNPHDRKLLKALQNNEEWAFGMLIDLYHSKLLRLAMTFVPTSALAETIVQNTWKDVLEGIGKYEGQVSLKSWIFKTLHTRMCQFHGTAMTSFFSNVDKQEQHQLTHSQHTEDSASISSREAKSTRHARQQSTHQQSTAHKQEIEQTFASCTPIQRQVSLLRDIELFTPEEVRAILQISENTYLTALQMTRTRLNAKMHHKPEN